MSQESNGLVDQVIRWESGSMSSKEEVEFFQKLVDTGLAWSLQGTYARRAEQLIRDQKVKRT